MIRQSLEQISTKTTTWTELITDSAKLVMGIILALVTLTLSVRGVLLFISSIRADYSWTYLIWPLFTVVGTVAYFSWCDTE